jgi:HAD superfamily hydrolase (TIGR01509 family)
MARIKHIFLDDGDVMNDNAVRGPQWQRLIGEFFVPRLGGTMEAWAEANRTTSGESDARYEARLVAGVRSPDLWRDYEIDWLRSMAAVVGVETPSRDDECYALARAALLYIRPRISAAHPGAVDAIRELSLEYELFTASNEHSEILKAYLEGMGVIHLFHHNLYGPDLVGATKSTGQFYERVFAHAVVDPAESLVLDDKLFNLECAAQAGAQTILVSLEGASSRIATIRALSELPALLRSGLLE